MPGWKEFVLDAKEAASDAYDLWHQWNKPKHGPIFTARAVALAVYAMAVCLSVCLCLSVCVCLSVCHKSVFY